MTDRYDDRFLSRPELPQYGKELTCCYVGLPKPKGIWKKIGLIFLLSIPVVLSVTASQEHFPDSQAMQSLIVIAVLVGTTGLGYWILTEKPRAKRSEALFVFDGGIHLNEIVYYTVPGGRRLEFCSGMRQVSLPLRVLKDFEITETTHRGESYLGASFKIPDGRWMQIASNDGHESLVAIKTIQDKLAILGTGKNS